MPLYAAPDDLLTIDLTELYPELKDKRLRGRVDGRKVVPYWPRADIERGKAPLDGKALVYVEDPVDAFFLQIQGSGRVQLTEGGIVRIGYADQNGRPYRSVARMLIDRGELSPDRASMQAIREWGRRHPQELPAVLDENPSYVFFREVPAPAAGTLEAAIDGPIGTLGVPLAAGRTLAVDPRSIPLGAPVFLATTWPLSSPAPRATHDGPGHGRRDPRRGPRGFLLGLRRRRGPRGGPDAPGRPDVDPVAEGRGAAEGGRSLIRNQLLTGQHTGITRWPSTRHCRN